MRATVQDLGLPHVTSSHRTVTVSVGVAATLPNDAQTPGDLIEAADAALYAAKHRGRNTVVEHGFAKLVDDSRDGDGGVSGRSAPPVKWPFSPPQPVDPAAAFVA